MGKKRKQLSQAEVWDDSALLRSWDDALAEYKLYHSIHARGERVEDVIKDHGAEDEGKRKNDHGLRQAAPSMQNNGSPSVELEDGELDEPESAQALPNGDLKENCYGAPAMETEHKQDLAHASTAEERPEKSGMPNAIMNGVKDEALKNLMMSWYYAGYYTGLYEGQQAVQSDRS